jgi:phage terminase large subunit-like protein
LVGAPCFGALDLGQSDDFSAWLRGWDLEDGRLVVTCRFWVPAAALVKYPGRPYEEWKRSGILTVTDGDITDYDTVQTTIAADCLADGVREVAYDKRFAEQMAQNLTGQGVTMINTPQGFQLHEAIRKKLELITAHQLCHGNNAILTWMAGNYVVLKGTRGEMRPAKERAAEKIDGLVALDMLIDRIIRQPVLKPPNYQLIVLGHK